MFLHRKGGDQGPKMGNGPSTMYRARSPRNLYFIACIAFLPPHVSTQSCLHQRQEPKSHQFRHLRFGCENTKWIKMEIHSSRNIISVVAMFFGCGEISELSTYLSCSWWKYRVFSQIEEGTKGHKVSRKELRPTPTPTPAGAGRRAR